MKPCAFDYERAETVAAACRTLAGDPDARPIAGGQSLIPMLAMRLARPSRLVDISRIPEMAGIGEADGYLVIGAATRQLEVQRSAVVRAKLPLLAKAIGWVGHLATRSRGTVGGSIAHADPSAEIPLVALTAGAELTVASGGGREVVPLDGFFLGPTITALDPAALIVDVRFPQHDGRRVGTAFQEVSPRRGDFALVAAAAEVVLDDDSRCADLRVGIGGAGDVPLRLGAVGTALCGRRFKAEDIAQAVAAAVAGVETESDLHASAEYRKRAAAALARRAIAEAWEEALQGEPHARRSPH